MPAADPVTVPNSRRRMRSLTLLALVAALFVILLVGGVGVGYLISEQKVRAELDRIRAAGEPVTPDDLDALYTLPPSTQDAAVLWLAAAEAVSRTEYEAEAQRLGVSEFPFAEPWVYDLEIEQFLGKHAGILAMIHRAAALGGDARYATKFKDGVAMSLDSQNRLRAVCRLLTLERETNIRRGDAHAAANSVRAGFALARSFKREPILIAELLRAYMDREAENGLQRLLLMVDLAEDDLSAVDHDLATLEYFTQFHSSLLGERVLGMQSFDDLRMLGNDAPAHLLWRLFRPGDRAVYLQAMRELVAASAMPDYLSLRAAVDRAQRDVGTFLAAPSARWRYPMSKMLLPALDSTAVSIGLATARRDVARTAIGVERFRRANIRLPNTLDELVPGFIERTPMDPFNGNPLHWVVTGDEYRVYSVGVDGIDEGGAEEATGGKGDICFRGRLR